MTNTETASLIRRAISELHVLGQMPRSTEPRVLEPLTRDLRALEAVLLNFDANETEAGRFAQKLADLKHDIQDATAAKVEADQQRLSAEQRRDAAIEQHKLTNVK